MAPSGLSLGLPPQAVENFAWSDGHLAIYTTCRVNIHVGLLNLLLPDLFPGVSGQ